MGGCGFYIYTDGNPLNTRRLDANYILEFSDFDQIRDLFRVQIGNEYMENIASLPRDAYFTGNDGEKVYIGEGYFSGILMVVTEGDIPIAATISSVFEIEELLFLSNIWINLDGHILTPEDIGFYSLLRNDPGAVRFTYHCESNGIAANILINEGWQDSHYSDIGDMEGLLTFPAMEIYFFYDEVFYYLFSHLWDVDHTHDELLEIAKRFINAFY